MTQTPEMEEAVVEANSHFTAENAYAAVAKGAAFLDDHCPNWFNEINLNQLDLSSTRRCMLGQLADCLTNGEVESFTEDSYYNVKHYFNFAGRSLSADGVSDVERLGFDSYYPYNGSYYPYDDEGRVTYEMLNIAWTELILERRAGNYPCCPSPEELQTMIQNK